MRLRSLLPVVLLATFSLLLLPTAPAWACWAAITFDEAVASAEYIVIGRVGPGGDPYWFEEPGQAGSGPVGRVIITPLLLTVAESLKGPAAPGETLTIGQLGGQIGEQAMSCSAERYLDPGTYLLFLCPAQGLWAEAGLRVSQEWSIAGSSLAAHPLWPQHRTLPQVKAEIGRILGREADQTPPGSSGTRSAAEGDCLALEGILVGALVGGLTLRRAAGTGVTRKRP
jgi:hypothetical protein